MFNQSLGDENWKNMILEGPFLVESKPILRVNVQFEGVRFKFATFMCFSKYYEILLIYTLISSHVWYFDFL